MEPNVWNINKAAWEKIKLNVGNSVVFLDNKVAEILHWSSGASLLFDAGALDVREFSSFENGSDSQQKAVFIVGSPLCGVTQQIVEDIVRQSHFQYVIVVTTACELLHGGTSDKEEDDVKGFEDIEELILEWMGDMSYTAQVCHVPLFACDVCPRFFITPAFSKLFPLLSSDLRQISYQYSNTAKGKDSRPLNSLSEMEFSHLPVGLQTQIRLLASGLDSLLESFNVKEDIYYIGDTSRIIASELESYPPGKTRRKTAQAKASLVLIDRTLDMASAVTHQYESLLDRVVNTLPHLPGHTNDCLVDMRDVCMAYSKGNNSTHLVPPGCLASSVTHSPRQHLMPLVTKKQKEALMGVNRHLIETASQAKLPLDLSRKPSRITAELLDSTIGLFRGKYQLVTKHLDVLQVAMAISQTLKDPAGKRQDGLIAKEKNLVQTIADAEDDGLEDGTQGPSPLSILSRVLLQEMEKDPADRDLTLDDFVGLIAYFYAISDGGLDEDDEAKMIQERLVQAVIKDRDCLPSTIRALVGDKVTEGILPDQIESLWDKLEAMALAREHLTQFNSVLDHGDAMSPASVKPLLRQVMERILDPAKPEIPDIACKTGGLKDLLKSGFGLFKSASKPRPGDSPLLIIFVVGGVTATEVKQVMDVVEKAKPGFEVLIGSTRISNTKDCLQSLLTSDNINVE